MGVESAAWKVFAWLATYALHSTVLIAAAWLAALALDRMGRLRDLATGIREWMWKLALFGGLATATAQVGFSIETWRLEWIPSTIESAVVEQPRAAPVALALDPSLQAPWTFAPVAARAPRPNPSESNTAVNPLLAPALFQLRILGASGTLFPVASIASPAGVSSPVIMHRPVPWVVIALGVWLTGIAIGLVRWAREWQRLARCVRGRVAIESGLVFRDLEMLRKRAGYGRRVRLSCAPGIAAPLTMGVLRAEICLPPRALRALQRDEIRAVLAHELAHAVRSDTAWLCLCRLLEITFFFQPLNRVARRLLQEDVESLCDDWAVVHTGECVPLASSLTEIAGWIVGEHRRLPAPAMVAHGSALSQRVRRLLDEERAPVVLRGRMRLTAIASLCCAGAALALPGVATSAPANRAISMETACNVDDCDDEARPEADECQDCEIDGASPVIEPPAEWSAPPLMAASSTIAALLSAPSVEPLDVSGLREQIASLQRDFDSLQVEATLFGADELQPQLDALTQRLDSLHTMQARLHELLQRYQHSLP